MSDARAHLTDGEKRELAHGLVEHGPTVAHLDECEACAADVERLCVDEEDAVYARAAALGDSTSPEWLREAGDAALEELRGEPIADPEARRVSGKWTIPLSSRGADSNVRREPSRARFRAGPILAVGATSAVAIAASIALLVRPSDGGDPGARERSGGVSAELYCAQPGSSPRPLGAVNARCPAGAELVVKATPAPKRRLPFLTVVGCSGNRCEIASQARFEGDGDLTVAGPLVEPGERVEVIVIGSDSEPSDASILEAAKNRVLRASVPVLALPGSWGQVGFVVEASDGTLR